MVEKENFFELLPDECLAVVLVIVTTFSSSELSCLILGSLDCSWKLRNLVVSQSSLFIELGF